MFAPPYSTELNAIEKTWAKLKDFIRRFPTLTRVAFDTAMCSHGNHCGHAVCRASNPPALDLATTQRSDKARGPPRQVRTASPN